MLTVVCVWGWQEFKVCIPTMQANASLGTRISTNIFCMCEDLRGEFLALEYLIHLCFMEEATAFYATYPIRLLHYAVQ